MSSVLKATAENKTTSEFKRAYKILYKQTKLLKNTDEMPMTSVMTSLVVVVVVVSTFVKRTISKISH